MSKVDRLTRYFIRGFILGALGGAIVMIPYLLFVGSIHFSSFLVGIVFVAVIKGIEEGLGWKS